LARIKPTEQMMNMFEKLGIQVDIHQRITSQFKKASVEACKMAVELIVEYGSIYYVEDSEIKELVKLIYPDKNDLSVEDGRKVIKFQRFKTSTYFKAFYAWARNQRVALLKTKSFGGNTEIAIQQLQMETKEPYHDDLVNILIGPKYRGVMSQHSIESCEYMIKNIIKKGYKRILADDAAIITWANLVYPDVKLELSDATYVSHWEQFKQ
jgi:hypothetical protein